MSVDPYMRPYVMRLSPPFTMIGTGVYKVRESRDPWMGKDSNCELKRNFS